MLLPKKASRVPVAQAGLALVNWGAHGPPPAPSCLHACGRSRVCRDGRARFALEQLEEHGDLGPQTGHQACPQEVHGLLIALHQALQKFSIEPEEQGKWRTYSIEPEEQGRWRTYSSVLV